MVPLGPYFKNRGISGSLARRGKRVNELVPFGVARGTSHSFVVPVAAILLRVETSPMSRVTLAMNTES
jgi:hypothetical protein